VVCHGANRAVKEVGRYKERRWSSTANGTTHVHTNSGKGQNRSDEMKRNKMEAKNRAKGDSREVMCLNGNWTSVYEREGKKSCVFLQGSPVPTHGWKSVAAIRYLRLEPVPHSILGESVQKKRKQKKTPIIGCKWALFLFATDCIPIYLLNLVLISDYLSARLFFMLTRLYSEL
jgi:hypothetical protein